MNNLNNKVNTKSTTHSHLQVCELFASIQGEGITTGTPAVFVRFSGCNLTCKFCDTPFTWNFEGTDFVHNTKAWEKAKYFKNAEMSSYTSMELVDKILELSNNKINTVVLTGGEPMLYHKTAVFLQLLRLLKQYRFRIEVETNGTICPIAEVARLVDQFNVSLKLTNSGVSEKKRIIDNAVLFFVKNFKTSFKFVIENAIDVEEVKMLQNKFNIPTGKILLMPEGRTEEEIKTHARIVVDICMNNGYTFCNRLHIWLWGGEKRGI